jgi:hypothetical protein
MKNRSLTRLWWLRTSRLTGVILVTTASAGLGVGLSAGPASAAAGVGYVRLAHLSPDTPAVDVYLTSISGSIAPKVFHAVDYGVVSPYLSLPAGAYTVAMRKEDAAAWSPPVLSTQVTVSAGSAYTVAGVGRYANLGLRVITDDLAQPQSGKAKIRVVQASVRNPMLDVSVSGGASIASNVAFASTTDYQTVNPGKWTCDLQPPGKSATAVAVSLQSGAVYSMIVLDKPSGGLKVVLRTDAQGGTVVPAGAVETGGGGMAPGVHSYRTLAAGMTTALLVVAFFVVRRHSVRPGRAVRRW